MRIPTVSKSVSLAPMAGQLKTELPNSPEIDMSPLVNLAHVKSEELEISALNQALNATDAYLRERKNNAKDGYFTRHGLLATNATQEFGIDFDNIVQKQSENIQNPRIRMAYLRQMDTRKRTELNAMADYERGQIMQGRKSTIQAAQENGLLKMAENKDNPSIVEHEIKAGLARIDADNFLDTKQGTHYKQSPDILKAQKLAFTEKAYTTIISADIENDPYGAEERLKRYQKKISPITYQALTDKIQEQISLKVTDTVSRDALALHNEDSERAKNYIEKNVPTTVKNRDEIVEKTKQAYFQKLGLFQKENNEQKRLKHTTFTKNIDAFFYDKIGSLETLNQQLLAVEDSGTRKAFQNYINQNASIETDPATYLMLSNIALQEKKKFINIDLMHYVDRLSKVDRERLLSIQEDLIKQENGKESSGKYSSFMTSNEHLRYLLKLKGIEKDDDNYQAEYVKNALLLENAVNEYEYNQLGGKRKANTAEIEAIIDRMAGNFYYDRPYWFDKEIKLPQIANKPADERMRVYRPLDKIALSDLNALQQFLMTKGISGDPFEDDDIKEIYEKLYPAIIAKDAEVIELIIQQYKGKSDK